MKKPLFLISFAFIFLFLTVNLTFAALAGKVTLVEGRVDVLKAGKDVVTPVKLGDPVGVGDIFRAKSNGRAEITFLNGNLLRIAPNSRAEIKEFVSEGDKSSNVIKLHRGRVQAVSGDEFIKKVAAFAEGNKFEVHTPNAVAGIRGSNMLVSFIRNITATLFLQGRGYQYNPSDPGRRVVDIVAGNISFVTAPEAPPTPPRKATEGEQATFVRAVEPVAPTGTTQDTTQDPTILASATQTPGPSATPTPTPPPPEPTPPPPPPPPPTPPTPAGTNLTGTASFFYGVTGDLKGNIPDTGTGTISASGPYSGSVPTTLEGWLYGTSDKGGAFSGPLAGVQGSYLNTFSAFYIENNNLYFLSGDAPGTYDGSVFSINGSLNKSPSIGTKTLTPDPTLLDALEMAMQYGTPPKFFPSNYIISNSGIEINPTDYGHTASSLITNEGKKVSIIGNMYEGSYNPTTVTNLPYLGYAGYPAGGNNEYALGGLTYSFDSATSRFVIDTSLKSIGMDYSFGPFIGTYTMHYLGKLDGSSFRMAGAGTFVSDPAAFLGYWGGVGSLYYNNNGVITYAGPDNGLFGGLTPPWSEATPFIAIGEYGPITPSDKPHYLLNTYISALSQTQTTSYYIPGSIYGYAGAIWKDGSTTQIGSISDGIIRAFYVSPTDASGKVTAGIMKGVFSGSYYPFTSGPQMWSIDGTNNTLTPTPITTGLDPNGLTFDSAYYQYGGGYNLSGSFGGTGTIYGSIKEFKTDFLVYNQKSLPFGIFNARFGYNPGLYYEKPSGTAQWSAKLGGDGRFDTSLEPHAGYWLANLTGTWTDSGEILGDVTGKVLTRERMYDLEGKFTGINQTGSNGTWIGQVLGSYYNAKDLSISGDVSGGLLYYNIDHKTLVYANPDPTSTTPNVTGIFGGMGDLWSNGSANFYMMGTYSDGAPYPYSDKPRLAYGSGWYLSYDPTIWTSTSSIGGAFKGYNVGTWLNNTVNTEALAIYIDPDKNAGYVGGMLSGNYYNRINMWDLAGTLNKTFVKATNIAPADLFANLDSHKFEGVASGRFTPSGGTMPKSYFEGATLGLTNQNWGIWNLGMGGTYTGAIKDNQEFDFVSYFFTGDGYLLGHANTKTTSASPPIFSGSLYNSKFLTPYYLGTLEGNIYGTIDTELATWQAAGIGKWQAQPLTASIGNNVFSTPSVSLFRAQTGTYYEGGYSQFINNNYEEYEFEYIKTAQSGIGAKKDGPDGSKTYLPNGTMLVEDPDGKLYYTQPWDITDISSLRNVPSWMDPSNPSFSPIHYSQLGPIDVLEKRASDSLDAILGARGYPWTQDGMAVNIIGKYTASDNDYTKPTLFTTPMLTGKFYTSVSEGTELGAYAMSLGGIITDDARGVMITGRGLFVGPNNQTAGIFKQSQLLTGNLYKDINMWVAEGSMTGTVMNNSFSTNPAGVTKDNLDANIMNGVFVPDIKGRLTNNDTVIADSVFATLYASGATRFIKGQDWGVFNSTIWSGGFAYKTDTQPTTWQAQVGGEAHFGAYQDNQSQWIMDQGYFIIPNLKGTISEGLIKANIPGEAGIFMTMTKMGGIFDVGAFGVYDTSTKDTVNSWQGFMGGAWKTTDDFNFAARFGSEAQRYGKRGYGGYSADGYTYYNFHYDNEEGQGGIIFYSKDGQKTYSIHRKYDPNQGPFETPGYQEFKYTYPTQTTPGTFSDYVTGTDYPAGGFTDDFFKNIASEKGYLAPNYTATQKGIFSSGHISAIMGGYGDLWAATQSNPATFYLLGEFDKESRIQSVLFGDEITSYNVKNNTSTTLDGQGAFTGYIGGREIGGDINGAIYAIYLEKINDTKSKAGIIKGGFAGDVYDYTEMWYGAGSLYPVYLMDKQIPYTSLTNYVHKSSFSDEMQQGQYSFVLNNITVDPQKYNFNGSYMALFDQYFGSFGVWSTIVGGDYSGFNMTDNWNGGFYFEDPTRIINIGLGGTKWSDNKIEAFALGYGADILPPVPATWISVGEAIGSFNPNFTTFTMGLIGASIETNTYLELAKTDDGRAQLQKLNIPCVEVGSATLTGSGNNFDSLAMNNVKFFATSQTQAPVLWATNSVTGSYSAPPALNQAIGLGGNGLYANFTFRQWNTAGDNAGKWLATVNGSGTLSSNSIQFYGASAGTGATAYSGNINGTAAGVARPVTTQP